MNVERDENGRLKPGSVLNPYGNTKAKAWNKLKEKIYNMKIKKLSKKVMDSLTTSEKKQLEKLTKKQEEEIPKYVQKYIVLNIFINYDLL